MGNGMKGLKDWRVSIAAILAIMVLEGFALYQGIDNALLSIAVAAIAGIAGYAIPIRKK